MTWAVALGIEGVLGLVYSTTYRSTIPSYANGSWSVGGFAILQVQVYAFAMSVVVLSLLGLVLAKTRFGRAVRGTVQNPTSAALLGVDDRKVAAIGFGISVATAAAAGAVYGIVTPFNPGSHYDLISLLLTIIVLGGMGSLPGTIVAALLVGVSEALLATYISPTWAKFAFFILLIAVLVVRPARPVRHGRAGQAVRSVSRSGVAGDRRHPRRARRVPLRLPRELGREHRGVHDDVRGTGDGVEPVGRLLRLPLAWATPPSSVSARTRSRTGSP